MAGIKYANPALRSNYVRITQGPHGGMRPRSSLDMVKYYSLLDDIIAVATGTVVFAGYSSDEPSYGYRVDLKHDFMTTRYAHMAKGSIKVKKGERVSKGTVLGRMGNTGNSTGAHLHFEIVGSSVSPYQVLAGTVKINNSAAASDVGLGITANKTPAKTAGNNFGYLVGKTYRIIAKKGLNVRTGPGIRFSVKPRNRLTPNARANTKSQRSAALRYGTSVTCKAIAKVGKDVWIKIPSGWICARQGSKVYVK